MLCYRTNKTNKKVLLASVIAFIFFPLKSFAFCPLCVISTGFIAIIFRWLGIDDSILGLWVGSFLFSLSILTDRYLKRKVNLLLQLTLIISSLYVFSASMFLWTNSIMIGNNIIGINKIIFGMLLGGLIMILSPTIDRFIRKQNQGKIFVSHQKVIIAISILLIISLVLFLMIK